jgi:ankyrin repeat protein
MRLLQRLLGIKPRSITARASVEERLLHSAEKWDLAEVKVLLAAGANVNASRMRGGSRRVPLIHLALGPTAQYNEAVALPVIEALLDAGADIDVCDEFNSNWTPLMSAAFGMCPKIVKLLIERGADTRLEDDSGRTVFALILQQDDEYHEVLSILADATEDGRLWLKSARGQAWLGAYQVDKNAPLPLAPAQITDVIRKAFRSDDSHELQQIKRWVEAGGNLEWRTPNGWTLLHIAAQCGNERFARFLLDKGADINARDRKKETPLMLACNSGYVALIVNPAVVKLLLDHNVDAHARNCDAKTALDLILESEQINLGESGLINAKTISALLEIRTGIGQQVSRPAFALWKEAGVVKGLWIRDYETTQNKTRLKTILAGYVMEGLITEQCAKGQHTQLELGTYQVSKNENEGGGWLISL